MDGLTLEHVLALVVQNTRPGLQVLALEELGHGDGGWVRRARSDRLWPLTSALLLLLLGRVLMGVLPLELCLRPSRRHLLHLLPLNHLDKLWHGDARLLGIGSELALHHLDLLLRRLLAGLQRGRAAWTGHFACAGWCCGIIHAV